MAAERRAWKGEHVTDGGRRLRKLKYSDVTSSCASHQRLLRMTNTFAPRSLTQTQLPPRGLSLAAILSSVRWAWALMANLQAFGVKRSSQRWMEGQSTRQYSHTHAHTHISISPFNHSTINMMRKPPTNNVKQETDIKGG